jgi:hypothetical protein
MNPHVCLHAAVPRLRVSFTMILPHNMFHVIHLLLVSRLALCKLRNITLRSTDLQKLIVSVLVRNPLFVPIPSQISPVQLPPDRSKIDLNIILPSTARSGGGFPSRFLTKILYARLLFTVRAKFPDHLILVDIIVQYLVSSAHHEAPCYTVFSIQLLPRPS